MLIRISALYCTAAAMPRRRLQACTNADAHSRPISLRQAISRRCRAYRGVMPHGRRRRRYATGRYATLRRRYFKHETTSYRQQHIYISSRRSSRRRYACDDITRIADASRQRRPACGCSPKTLGHGTSSASPTGNLSPLLRARCPDRSSGDDVSRPAPPHGMPSMTIATLS